MRPFHPDWNRQDVFFVLAMTCVLAFCVLAAVVCSRPGSQIAPDRTPWVKGEAR